MKTNLLKKWSKRLLIFGVIIFTSLFVWANWEPSTITEQLPKINIVSFDLSSLQNEDSYEFIQKEFKSKKGITAVAVNSDSKMATFTFNPKLISKETILVDLKNLGNDSICFKIFPSKAGCPIKGTRDFFGKIKESLKFR